MSKSNLQLAAWEVAGRMARKVFAGDYDAKAKVCDVQSIAWEIEQRAPPGVKPGQIAWYAIARRRMGRQFPRSSRSIDATMIDQQSREIRPRMERVAFDVADLSRPGDDPATIVQVRMDIETWWAGLTDKQRQVAAMLAQGERPRDVAKAVGVVPGRISNLRDTLAAKWMALQS